MKNPLLVGTDVHRKQNVVAVMDRNGGEVCARFRVDNNRPGTEQLSQQLVKLLEEGAYDGVELAAEATGWYWFHLFQQLSQDAPLNQWPLDLYALNPRLTANYKRTYSDLDKTDRIDAFVTADRLRMGRDLPPPFHYDERFLPLRLLTRFRYHLVHNLAREKAYCLAILYLKASDYTRPECQPFADVFGAASRAVLEEFASIEAIAALPFAELVEFIDGKGKRHFADPSDNAHKLQQVAQTSYRLPATMQGPVNLVLQMALAQITHFERQETRLNTAIAEQMAAIPQTLATIPGFGPVFSAGILAEIGDPARFAFDEAKVAKFAGFKWRKTGGPLGAADFVAEETRLTRTGNRYLRYYFCEAANIVRMRDADYAAFYDRKFHEVRKHQHKRALVLTARKLVRLVVRLLTTNQPYRPRRCNP